MFLTRAIAATSLIALAVAEPLTTIVPCKNAPRNITVTAQHQPVSTCTYTASSFSWSTYNYVSTVIPCWGNASISSCTVTNTAQPVPCSGTASTITSLIPTSTAKPNGTYTTYNLTKYETVSKNWVAPYNKLGPFAIPGYGGCELCTDCGVQGDGNRKQMMDATECSWAPGKAPVCSKFVDTWVSRPAPSTTGAVTATVSTNTAVPHGGIYTFTFPQSAPATTIVSNKQSYTVPGRPWWASVTRSFAGPTSVDFVVTITKTVTFTMPYSTATDPKKTPDPEGFAHKGWGPWQQGNPARPTPGRPNNPWGRPPPSSSQQGNDPSDPPSVTSTPAAQQGNQQGGSGWGPWPRPDAGTTTTLTTSTLTTSTSTTTTTTIIDGPEETSGFYIEVTYSGLKRRYMKRGDTSYVGFLDGSDDASVVTENPYKFFFDRQGYLRTGRQYVAADASTGYFVFEKTSSKPASVPKYKLTADGMFTHESGGFCATTSNFFVTFGSAPGNCRPVTCRSRSKF